MPNPLKALLYIDLSVNYEEGINRLIKTIYGVSDKPKIGKVPKYIKELQNNVRDLTRLASTVALYFISDYNRESGNEKLYQGDDIKNGLPFLSEEEINDSIDELLEINLIKVSYVCGTDPYEFADAEPTYLLFLYLRDEGLNYDPIADIKIIACCINDRKNVEGPELMEFTKLSAIRINRAVAYLKDNEIVNVFGYIGTAPFNFGIVEATRKTREFVSDKCK